MDRSLEHVNSGENGDVRDVSNESTAKWCMFGIATFPHLGMRFRCRHGGGGKQGAVPGWRVDFQKTGGAARASPSLIGGLCPAATLSSAPRTQIALFVGRAAEEGLVRARLSGRSPGISEVLISKKNLEKSPRKKMEKNLKTEKIAGSSGRPAAPLSSAQSPGRSEEEDNGKQRTR
ncbi:hypothetical protein KM043_002158 [Ampulex compressa]|nr:hypothetical protein KM043_002158 [Ampulex compressa]